MNIVILESDSTKSIELVLGSQQGNDEERFIIQMCRALHARAWRAEIKCVFKEANRVADRLAK